jgi:VWFA-related protein
MLLIAAPSLCAFQLTAADPPPILAVRSRPAAPAPAGVPPAPLLRIDANLVLIPVHVTNAEGGTVAGIPQHSFRILEDNAEQKIATFGTEDAPVSVGLLFDASGSMRPKIGKAAEAAAAFFRASNPADEFFLVEFSDRARLVVPFTPNSEDVYREIVRTKPGGRTSLLDAIYLATAQMKKARNARKAIVIVSDGGDNWSRRSVHEVREGLLESDLQVYAMGIFDPDILRNHPIEERNGPALLDELTMLTGGRHFPVDTLDELPDISERIGRELHSQYMLGYYSTNPARDGKYRQVKVMLDLPDLRGLHITYRHGYYGPESDANPRSSAPLP